MLRKTKFVILIVLLMSPLSFLYAKKQDPPIHIHSSDLSFINSKKFREELTREARSCYKAAQRPLDKLTQEELNSQQSACSSVLTRWKHLLDAEGKRNLLYLLLSVAISIGVLWLTTVRLRSLPSLIVNIPLSAISIYFLCDALKRYASAKTPTLYNDIHEYLELIASEIKSKQA